VEEKKDKNKALLRGLNMADAEVIEVIVNDRLGKKEKIKCRVDDTVGNIIFFFKIEKNW